MSLVLQPANIADLPAIVRLMNAAFRSVRQNASWNSEAAYMEGDRTSESLLREEMAGKPESVLLVVREEATFSLQGCVWLEPISAETWYLGSLTIDPSSQNSGLGRKVLEAAEQYARERDAHTMQIKVINVRHTLIAWYERRGYRLTGDTHPFPYGDTRFGIPLRSDLTFVVLENSLTAPIPK